MSGNSFYSLFSSSCNWDGGPGIDLPGVCTNFISPGFFSLLLLFMIHL